MAAVYHFKLCRANLVAFRRHLQKDGICKDGFIDMMEKDLEPQQLPALAFTNNIGEILDIRIDIDEIYKDDLTGQLLDSALVKAARAKELEYFESKGVWQLRRAEEARKVWAEYVYPWARMRTESSSAPAIL